LHSPRWKTDLVNSRPPPVEADSSSRITRPLPVWLHQVFPLPSAFLRRYAMISRQTDEPPGSPRLPLRSAASIPCQVSPADSGMRPDDSVGHFPVRRRCARAQLSTCLMVSLS